jgi:hypothetical protein
MSEQTILDMEARREYHDARRKAFWHRICDLLKGETRRLLSLEEVRHKLHTASQTYRGIQTVELDQIVGTMGRYTDFDRAFLPLKSHTAGRWMAIAKAYRDGEPLPPVQLYKIGDAYFVRDGHHRVSVAREHGMKSIEAEVIEFRTRVPIGANISDQDLDLKAAYVEFLEATDLDRLRPEQQIECTAHGAYGILLEHIGVHRYFLGLEKQRDIAWREAVLSWYDDVYCPVVEMIREHDILEQFPGRKESDLYLWLMDHLYFLRQGSEDISIEEAAADLAEQDHSSMVTRALRSVQHVLQETVERALPTHTVDETVESGPVTGEPNQQDSDD